MVKEKWDACSDKYFTEKASEETIRRIIEDPS